MIEGYTIHASNKRIILTSRTCTMYRRQLDRRHERSQINMSVGSALNTRIAVQQRPRETKPGWSSKRFGYEMLSIQPVPSGDFHTAYSYDLVEAMFGR